MLQAVSARRCSRRPNPSASRASPASSNPTSGTAPCSTRSPPMPTTSSRTPARCWRSTPASTSCGGNVATWRSTRRKSRNCLTLQGQGFASTMGAAQDPSGATPVMTKADLVEEVTKLGDLTRRDSEVIVETIFDSVIGALRSGDKIEIRGFGSFRIRQRKPRIGRNPKTGTRVEVPAKKVPYFKPSKELRDLVNPTGKQAGEPAAPPPAAEPGAPTA